MYHNNVDGFMFKAMKGYNREQDLAQTQQGTKTGKFLANVGQALVTAGEKLQGQNQVGATGPRETRPAS